MTVPLRNLTDPGEFITAERWNTMQLSIYEHIRDEVAALRAKIDARGAGRVAAISGFGIVPIGSIVAWHKSLANTPELPEGWLECNGQTVDDSQSPYNGQALPNLNEEGRFIRGSTQSGVMQAQDWKSFSVAGFATGPYTHDDVLIPKSGYNTTYPWGGLWPGSPGTQLRFKFDESEVRPANMSVVWIVRVK